MASWPEDVTNLLTWFQSLSTPAHPFQLDSARRVIDPLVFFQWLHQEITKGPASPRASFLIDDLRLLRKQLG